MIPNNFTLCNSLPCTRTHPHACTYEFSTLKVCPHEKLKKNNRGSNQEQGTHGTGKTGKMAKKYPCQGKHRDFRNFAKTQGIWFAQVEKSLILKQYLTLIFWAWQPTASFSYDYLSTPQILSAIRADYNVIFSKFVSPDEESSTIG